ncbi:MAG: hypothetical protein AAGA77_17165 [Bacteroidota bacterium]
MYDPAIARFTSVDPIAEEFAQLSTFNYVDNSPNSNIDLHGLRAKSVIRNRMSIHIPVGRKSVTITNVKTSSLVYGKSTSNIEQVTTMTLDESGSLVSGSSSVNSYNRGSGRNYNIKNLSFQELSEDSDGNIPGLNQEMNVMKEVVENDGIIGGVADNVINAERGSAAAGVAGLLTGAEMKGAKFGVVGKMMQAFGIGAFVGSQLSSYDDINLSSRSVDVSEDTTEVKELHRTLEEENENHE